MRHRLKTIIIMAISLALVGCGASVGDNANATSIKIGVNYELSGAVSSYGTAGYRGTQLAIEQINAAGGVNGKQIQEIRYDSKSEPAEAMTLATKLTSEDGAVAMIGPASSGAFKATVPVANKHQVPSISGSATANDTTVLRGKVQPYAFRTCFTDDYQGRQMAGYVVERKGFKKIAIIKDSASDYSQGVSTGFSTEFTKRGGEIVAEVSYSTGDQDFNALVTSLKNKQFDAVYLPGYYTEAGLIIKQARAQGITAPIIGADGWDSPKLVELAGSTALNNVFFSNHYSTLNQSPEVQNFIHAYQERYGETPGSLSALAYDATNIVAAAAAKADMITGPNIARMLAATTDFKGVTGTFSIDDDHNAVKPIIVISLENGQQVHSESYESA